MSLRGKKILVAVTGGIAAYKTPYLVRQLIKQGAEVRVIMTPAALDFVTPLVLSTLSKNEVYQDFKNENHTWNNHVELGLWADIMLIAPLTAHTLSSMAHGSCDNLVMATYLSAKCPVVVAPAMDLDMYKHPSTRENLNKIKSYGNHIIPAQSGELASGLIGEGRMEEPENIVSFIEDFFNQKSLLKGKKILVTAGPTYEAIDPVRFIGNHSSGKMGFEIAKKASEMGAEVTLITGPTAEKLNHSQIHRIDVISALDMLQEAEKQYKEQDVVIMSAAVADYRPEEIQDKKIKKKDEGLTLKLTKNPDILKTLGEKKEHQFLVGFALETNDALKYAESKLKAKNADLIVLNTLEDKGAGFGTSTNKVTFVTTNESPRAFDLKSKAEVAQDILTFIAQKI